MLIFADAHVHVHSCFPLGRFLDAASNNFKMVAEDCGAGAEWTAFLLLTESAGCNVFSQLGGTTRPSAVESDPWRFVPTAEDISIEAIGPSMDRLILVAGGQIVAAENLEVLSLGSLRRFEDRKPVRETIDQILETNALAVLPWGPGKWFTKRGKIVQDTIKYYGDKLFLGDNGNRPGFWPTPGIFKSASAAGLKILPGSDPLPFQSEAGRAGSFGFKIEGSVSASHPAQDLISHLRQPDIIPHPYGQLEAPGRFFRNQINMQIIKKGLKRE